MFSATMLNCFLLTILHISKVTRCNLLLMALRSICLKCVMAAAPLVIKFAQSEKHPDIYRHCHTLLLLDTLDEKPVMFDETINFHWAPLIRHYLQH